MVDDVPDFVVSFHNPSERAFYDDVYQQPLPRTWSETEIAEIWLDQNVPYLARLRSRVGDLGDKRVLTIGNGASVKEFDFLADGPTWIVFSDLSAHGMVRLRDSAPWVRSRTNANFAAIDAFRLPFPDESIDVLYGFAVVHHLPDVPRFLAEVTRVVAPGGRAVFFDDGYSPIWQTTKTTVLRPLMRWSQKKHGMSPEDIRFSLAGGFREADLGETLQELGVKPSFERTDLVYYLVQRGSEKLLPRSAYDRVMQPAIAGRLIAVDRWLTATRLGSRNAIRLLWGFEKPV